jgi:hypothetical protein
MTTTSRTARLSCTLLFPLVVLVSQAAPAAGVQADHTNAA